MRHRWRALIMLMMAAVWTGLAVLPLAEAAPTAVADAPHCTLTDPTSCPPPPRAVASVVPTDAPACALGHSGPICPPPTVTHTALHATQFDPELNNDPPTGPGDDNNAGPPGGSGDADAGPPGGSDDDND